MKNLFFFMILFGSFTMAESNPNHQQTQFLWKTINGTNLEPQSPTFKEMQSLIASGNQLEAARLATRSEESSIGIYAIKQIFTPLAGREVNFTEDVGDFTMAWIGAALTDQKIKDLFSDKGLHIFGNKDLYEYQMNSHSRIGTSLFLDQTILDQLIKYGPGDDKPRIYKPREIPTSHNLGVVTTSQYGKAIFEGGTNRRPVKKILEDFLCLDNIENIMSFSINDNWVGRDIPRSPGNNPKDYLNRCVGCHAGMDAARGAFARFDFVGGKVVYESNIQKKLNINSDVFPSGHQTIDESWEHTGWIPTKPDSIGQTFDGPLPFVNLITNNLKFYQCLSQRTQEALCPNAKVDEVTLAQIAYNIKKKQNLRELLAQVSANICMGESNE